MWERNLDTGKWSEEIDQLPKDYYDGIKRDIQSVRLYSKCLSGSVYMMIDDFDNIYNTLQVDRLGYYVKSNFGFNNLPPRGPVLEINISNYEEVYQKYLKDYAFTIKNLFTTTKLIKSESDNIFNVDLATTEMIFDLNSFNQDRVVDGLRLINGHRILVKNQITEITLSSNVNVENYFTNVEMVSNYYLKDSNVLDTTYYFYNNENGIYLFKDGLFVKETQLSDYNVAYKLNVFINYGKMNANKQFNLLRLKNNYYPKEGENVEFSERHNWILRHRLDYNNVLDLNYYDLLYSKSTKVYDRVENFTYSIPDRLIAVGEFGAIINNQDKIVASGNKTSTIVNSKYKVNLRSISESNDYYWVCGDEGTLLKIYKPNFKIERIDLGIYSQLTSIKFLDNLNGFVVGKFNIIYYTNDGGYRWRQLKFPEYESFSFNKVEFKDLNNVLICGTTGLFLELSRQGDSWVSYKRQIFKTKSDGDYFLVDDIFDLFLMKWNTIKPLILVQSQTSSSFSESLNFNVELSNLSYSTLQIDLTTKFTGGSVFDTNGKFYVGLSMSNSNGLIFSDNNFYATRTTQNNFNPKDFSFTKDQFSSRNSKQINLPKNVDGNLSDKPITIETRIYFNYNGSLNSTTPTYNRSVFTYSIVPTNSDLVLLPTFDKIIVYDKENKIYQKNNFIYYEFNKSVGDIRTITKPRATNNGFVYLAADKIYYFDFKDIINFTDLEVNSVSGNLVDGTNVYANRIYADDKLYVAGNESLFSSIIYSNIGVNQTISEVDSGFKSRYKSRLLFLDYDIASKLNFFTDAGQYRLPNSVDVTKFDVEFAPNASIRFKSLDTQKSWIDYYKDSIKTFRYYTRMSDDRKVEFSTTFTYTSNVVDFSIPQSSISLNPVDIRKFAPSVDFDEVSEFFDGLPPILSTTSDQLIQPTTLSNFDLMICKNIIIFKKDQNDITEVGDYIRLESDVVDTNLLVNRINFYYKPSGGSFGLTSSLPLLPKGATLEKYIYCFHTLNQNMINNLMSMTQSINFKLLNKYNNSNDLVYKFEKHPLSICYRIIDTGKNLSFSPRLNNKTAYYNLSSEIVTVTNTYPMNYSDSFLKFGYSPNYNLMDYLNKINNNIFTSDKKFTILPEYFDIPGTTSSTIFGNVIRFLDDGASNKLYFDESLKFEWTSLLPYTFVDVDCKSNDGDSLLTQRLLIVSKFYDSNSNSYVIELHKKINLPNSTSGLKSFSVTSRNTLSQISGDLQVLNNIQRSDFQKSINSTYSFTSLENEIKFRFPTDSYLKSFVSDYDVQQNLTGIIYTDDNYRISMNIINVEKSISYDFNAILKNSSVQGFNNKVTYSLTTPPGDDIKVGDFIFVELLGSESSSKFLNPQYQGYQTVIEINGQFITTSMEYGTIPLDADYGRISLSNKDAFLNYLPIDLYDIGSDKKPKQSIEILPEMVKLENSVHSLINVDTKRYKLRFVDGLFLQEIEDKFSWFLQADTSPAIIGKNANGLIWYQGVWKCGQWFGGTWRSGEWLSGDWYDGEWYSSVVKPGISSVEISTTSINNSLSKWQGGRWFGGKWFGGSWYDGRRYGGDWYSGIWYNGIWNEGNWYDGSFQGGIWILGKWYGGKFNCDSRLSYWLDGTFRGGDFENGIWYNGQFGLENILENIQTPRFGTRSVNTRVTIWHGGKWLNGEFHSVLNQSANGETLVSDIHNLSLWKTGLWLGGDFYGGIAYNIDFRGGTWHGGLLEQIQVIGLDAVYPGTFSTNKIYVNGNFKFNSGDEIYIIDDDKNTDFSPIGNNTLPRKYRINRIDEIGDSQTALYLNYNLSNLEPKMDLVIGSQTWSNIDTGLRVVSHFSSAYWKSGLWTNGYFEDGRFEGGIWYNGIMEGIMGS